MSAAIGYGQLVMIGDQVVGEIENVQFPTLADPGFPPEFLADLSASGEAMLIWKPAASGPTTTWLPLDLQLLDPAPELLGGGQGFSPADLLPPHVGDDRILVGDDAEIPPHRRGRFKRNARRAARRGRK